jgi:thiol-disulfide isomerase/thioredoxin
MLPGSAFVRLLIVALGFSLAGGADRSVPDDLARCPEDPALTMPCLEAAIAVDDGTTKLVWMTPDGVSWKLSLGVDDDRLVRAATIALAADRPDEARSWVALALGAGAEGRAEEQWVRLGGGAVPGLDPSPTDLEAPVWYPPLPDLEIPLLDGGRFDLASARGKILLLDFWASWCAPCLQELPRLQSLWESTKERGLVAVAINAQEPDDVARQTAGSLGLTLPIGRYTDSAHRQLRVNTLPTVILADRDGRIRERWNGYATGLEEAIAERVGALLEEHSTGTPVTVARVLSGAGRFRVRWRREIRSRASGLAVGVARDGTPRITVSEPGRVTSVGADGRTHGRFTVPPEVGRLVQGDGDGRADLVGFRPGGDRLALLDPSAGRHRLIDAPATLLDVAVSPQAVDGNGTRLVVATVDGLYQVDADNGRSTPLGEPGRRTGVAATGTGETVALDEERGVTWYGGDGAARRRAVGPAEGWTLVADLGSEGVGVLPAGEIRVATGSFSGGGRREVAVAGPSDQLVVAETETGETVFRARWPGVTALAAGDLDADGRDELVVAEGGALTVLEASPK